MLNRLEEQKDNLIIKFIKYIQFALLCLLIIMLTAWIAQIFQIAIPENVTPYIDSLVSIGGAIYGEKITIGLYKVNFAYLSTIILIALLMFLSFKIIELVKVIEQKILIKKEEVKKAKQEIVNNELKVEYYKEQVQYKNFAVLLDFNITSNQPVWNNDTTSCSAQDVAKKLIDSFENKLVCETEFIDDKLLIKFNSFSKFDINILILSSLLADLKKHYESCMMKVDWFAVIEVYKTEAEIQKVKETLSKLLELKVTAKFLGLSSLKARYELQANPKFDMKSIGFYVINENQEVFTLEKI